MLEEQKTLNADQAILKISECIDVQLRMDNEISSTVDLLAMDENAYEGLSNAEIDATYETIKNVLITVAAIKTFGFNKQCVDYLLIKKVIKL